MNETVMTIKDFISENLQEGNDLKTILLYLYCDSGYSREDIMKAYSKFRNEMIKEAENE